MTEEVPKNERPKAGEEARRAAVDRRRAGAGAWIAQGVLGLWCRLLFLPYLRRVEGLSRLDRGRRYLFLCNHTSLLDTILLGGIFWSHRRLPILVLGDRAVWHRSLLHRFLSSKVGFLIERDGLTKRRIQELQAFGRSCRDFNLFVFPEGTRGDGRRVQECQPGAYFVARAAEVPIVPVFIRNMTLVSSKSGRFSPCKGLARVRVQFGEEIEPDSYVGLSRVEFSAMVRERIQALSPIEAKQ